MDPRENFNDLNSNGKYDGRNDSHNGTADLGLDNFQIVEINLARVSSAETTTLTSKGSSTGMQTLQTPRYYTARKLLTGGSHKKKWPGDTDPVELNAQVRASTFPSNTLDSMPASTCQPNGFGIKDLLGNVAEWSESGQEPGMAND